MSSPVIRVENLSKLYRLGEVGTGSLAHDVNRWWHRIRGKEDPYTQVGAVNDRSKKAESDWVYALKDVNFEVQQGEVLGIIGRNGAGKSTLLKILSRVTAPTSGQVKVRERITALLEVGTGFHPELTGRENIFLNGAILGMTKAEIRSKLDQIVDFSGCEAYLDTPVKRYSSGMQVRLAFAVAAHLEPEILIVDEVLAVGDAEFQKKCIGRMSEVKDNGRTILFVSHNLAAVKALCPHSIIMNAGKLDFMGPTHEAISVYMSSTITPSQTDDLAHRIDRTGTGEIKITSFHMEGTNGQVLKSLVSGEDVICVLGYRCSTNIPEQAVDVGFSLSDINDNLLFVHYSSYEGVKFGFIGRSGFFRCAIRCLPISHGTYRVGARILVNGEESDWLHGGVGEIEIERGDYYKTGNPGFGGSAPLLIRAEWTAKLNKDDING